MTYPHLLGVDAAYIFVGGRPFHGTGSLMAPRSGTTPTNQPRVYFFLAFVKINVIMVNYGDIFLGKYWVFSCISRFISRIRVVSTRGRAIRPALKKRK